ncbi:hypothetical protein RI054_16g74880 [Pseudoscourfieldia marina]
METCRSLVENDIELFCLETIVTATFVDIRRTSAILRENSDIRYRDRFEAGGHFCPRAKQGSGYSRRGAGDSGVAPPSGDGATKEELAKKNALRCRVCSWRMTIFGGLERLLTCDYDALITDLNMPVMDGVQMLNEARGKQCLPRVAKLNSATTRTPEFLSSCGLNAEDVFDKCEPSHDVVKNVARQLVKREEFGSVDDVRIEVGASSSDNSAKSLGSGSNNSSSKRLLSRVASTSSPKDVRDVAEILEDSTVLKGLKARHGALSDAITYY